MELVDNTFEIKLASLHVNYGYFDKAYDAIIITTATYDNTILYANPAFCAMTGYTKEEIVGQNPRILQGEKTERVVIEKLKDTLSQGKLFEGQTINYKKDGTEYYVRWNIVPLLSEDGKTEAYISFQKDITAKMAALKDAKETHEKLEQSHEVFCKLPNQLPGIVYQYRLRPNGTSSFPYASANIMNIYEVTPEEVKEDASKVIERLHPDDLERVMKCIEESFVNLTQWNCDYRVILPSRGLRHLRGSANPEKEADGSVLWHGYIYDITDKKLTKALLEEKSILLETLLNESPNAIIVKNEDHSYRYANKALATLFGIQNPQELIGKRDEDFVHDTKQLEGYAKSINEAFDTMGKSFVVTEEVTDPITNTVHYFQSVKKAFMTPDGKRNALVIANEITDIYALNDTIKQSNEQLHYVLEATGEGVWDWDIVQQKVTHNTRWCTMLGLDESHKEHHESIFFNAIVPEDIPLVQNALQMARTSTKEYICEYRMFKLDGSLVWVEDHGKVVSEDILGNPTRMVGSIKEISERKEMIAQLELSIQEAQLANRAKSDFLANMSHEIRTPLNAVMGLTQLLRYDVTLPKHKEYLSKIYNSSQLLLTILNDILDHAKIESGKLTVEAVPFFIEETLENLSTLYMPQIDAKSLELFLDINPLIPQCVIGDPTRITQVLGNLLSNAIKFTEKGTIRICVDAYERDQELFLQFDVKDTGIGIDESLHEEVFHAFTQADASITRRYGGTGLGLSICKSLVEAMGGTIFVESKIGEGSNFSFSVKVKRDATQQIQCNPLQPHVKRILVIDDQISSIEIIERYVMPWKMDVHSTIHPHEALQKVNMAINAKQMYDVILVDWKMPDCDGIELAKKIHDMCMQMGVEKMPLMIMVSAHKKEALVEDMLIHSANFDAILTKPITQSQLYNAFTSKQIVEKTFKKAVKQVVNENIFHASVLVVEDSPFNQFVMQEMLERQGIKITLAQNGQEAIDYIQNDTFDVVFMDVHMPVMGGIAATRQIRLLKSLTELPIIAMTAATMEEDIEACLNAGMNEHIAKPFDYTKVVAVLHRYIKREVPSSIKTQSSSLKTETLDRLQDESVLSRLDISEEKYVSIVLNFAKNYENQVMCLREFIDNNELQRAKFWLHTLKGVSANFGFKALYEACVNAEETINKGQIFDAYRLSAFEQILSTTLDEIRCFEKSKESSVSLTQEEAFSYIVLLKEKLLQKKFISIELKMYCYSALPILVDDTRVCSRITKMVDEFCYGKALALIDAYIKDL